MTASPTLHVVNHSDGAGLSAGWSGDHADGEEKRGKAFFLKSADETLPALITFDSHHTGTQETIIQGTFSSTFQGIFKEALLIENKPFTMGHMHFNESSNRSNETHARPLS